MNFRCKFRHHRSIRRPRFPIRMQNFGDLATFFVDFCILYSECPTYFYFRFVWPTNLESIPHAPSRTLIIPTKLEVDMTIHCRVTPFLSGDTSRDLMTLTFDLFTLSFMAGHVTNPATKFEDPTTIRSWVTSYNGSHWLALEMRTRPLRMRRITWLVSRGSKTITYLESPTPICLVTAASCFFFGGDSLCREIFRDSSQDHEKIQCTLCYETMGYSQECLGAPQRSWGQRTDNRMCV